MAYDEDLAYRVRELVAAESGVSERVMFGGLAFLVGGNLAFAVSGQGGVLVRVDPADADQLVASTGADGNALPESGAAIELQGALDGDAGRFRASGVTDLTGALELDVLAGTYLAKVMPSSLSDAGAARTIAGIIVPPGESVATFTVVARAHLRGSVSAHGAIVRGVVVRATPHGDTLAAPVSALSDSNGRYDLPLDPGSYDLLLDPPISSGLGRRVIPNLAIGSTDARRDAALPTARLLTGVVNSEGSIVAHAKLRIYVHRVSLDEPLLPVGETETDENGRFSVLLPTGETVVP